MKIPEDNKYFHFYNANPKNKDAKDCTYRALALFLNKSWDDIARLDADFYLSHGMWFYTKERVGCLPRNRIDDYMNENGYKTVYSKYREDKFIGNIRKFIDNYAESKKVYLCVTQGHMLAIKDKKVWDTWDSSKRCAEMIFENM